MPLEDDRTTRRQPRLPGTVIGGIKSTIRILHPREVWIPNAQSVAMMSAPRLVNIAVAFSQWDIHEDDIRKLIRGGIIRALAYLKAESRISVIMEIARKYPEALDDILLGEIPDSAIPQRYNVFAALGIMARHSLINEVMDPDNVKAVRDSLAKIDDEDEDF